MKCHPIEMASQSNPSVSTANTAGMTEEHPEYITRIQDRWCQGRWHHLYNSSHTMPWWVPWPCSSMSSTAVAVLMAMPLACSSKSSPTLTGEPFFLLAPSKYMLWTAHKEYYWVLPTERMVTEVNIFPLSSSIFFDILQFFFWNNKKNKKKNPQEQFLKFPLMCFH